MPQVGEHGELAYEKQADGSQAERHGGPLHEGDEVPSFRRALQRERRHADQLPYDDQDRERNEANKCAAPADDCPEIAAKGSGHDGSERIAAVENGERARGRSCVGTRRMAVRRQPRQLHPPRQLRSGRCGAGGAGHVPPSSSAGQRLERGGSRGDADPAGVLCGLAERVLRDARLQGGVCSTTWVRRTKIVRGPGCGTS